MNPDRYFDLTHSLVNEHTTNIDGYHENTIDKAYKDGHYYSLGVPGPSLLGIPAYLSFKVAYKLLPDRLLKQVGNVQSFKQGSEGGFYQRDTTDFFLSSIWITWFCLSLLSALAAVVLFRLFLGLGVSRANSLLATVAYALGTPVFFYSTTYFSAGFAAAFVVFSLFLLFKVASSPRTWTVVVLGLCAASAVLMEYQTLVLAAGISVYMLLKQRAKSWVPFFLGAAIPCAVLLIYNTLSFGGPFHSAYQFVVGQNARFHNVGALGFLYPKPSRLFGLSFSTYRGIFVYSPVLLLTFVGFYRGLKQRESPIRPIIAISVIASALVSLWIASFSAWDGSVCFGPRLLISIIPFMAIGVALSLSTVPRAISFPLMGISIVINWLGAQTGFADNIWQPFQRFWARGFTLPMVDALISHARNQNLLTLFATNHPWLIIAAYASMVGFCVLLIFGSFFRTLRSLNKREISADAKENDFDHASGNPFVSVIMPVRNEAAFIERSLGAVLAQHYPRESFEVIVADGMSDDGTREIVAEMARAKANVTLIDNPKKIVATGLNAALRAAKGDVIIRVDGHCEIAPDYARNCVEHLLHDQVEAVGGPVETIGESYIARVIAAAMSSRFGVGGSAFRLPDSKTQFTDTVPFPAYTRAAIDRAGQFDEELVRNQDDEYNYRLRKLGVKILLASDVRSRYFSRATLRGLWRQYFQYGYWKVRVLQKHSRQMSPRQFMPTALILMLILAAIGAAKFAFAGYLLALICAAYLLASIVAALISARRNSWSLVPVLPLAFGVLHSSYGFGFLFGLLRFWSRWGNRDGKVPARAPITDVGQI